MARRATLTTVSRPDAEVADSVFSRTSIPSTPVFTAGEQTYIDKVKELEERFTPKSSRPRKKKQKKKKVVKRKRKTTEKRERKTPAIQLSKVIKGRGGVSVARGRTLRSLLRGVWWIKEPLFKLMRKGAVKLVDGHLLNKKTTLMSLLKNIPMSRMPLVDVIANKMM